LKNLNGLLPKKTFRYVICFIGFLIWIGFLLYIENRSGYRIFHWFGLAILCFAAVQDSVEGKVRPLLWGLLLLFEFSAFLLNPKRTDFSESVSVLVFGVLLGVVFLIFKNHIGLADIMVLISLSFGFGVPVIVTGLVISCFFIFIVGIILKFIKKREPKDGIPLIPILCLSLLVLYIAGLID
jgi:hypothetical protein